MARRVPAPLGVLAALLALYLAAPLLAGLIDNGTTDWAGVDAAGLRDATLVSLASASCATALIALGGIPLGYILAHVPGRAVRALGFVVQLPLALPPLTSGILLLFLFGYAGPVTTLTHARLTDSFAGIVLAQVFVAAPFLIIAARSAFIGIPASLEDVAATLGHGPMAIFRRVSLPLGWRTILAGLLLAWLRAFGEFGATVMIAYHPYSLPVYTYVAFGGEGLPAMLPVLLPTAAVAVAMMALSQMASPRAARPVVLRDILASPTTAPLSIGATVNAGPSLALRARHRVEGFQLDIAWHTKARRLAILGASGSGKSMTLRVIAGLDRAPESRVAFDGRAMEAWPPERRGIAYVPQNYALLPHLAVAEQVRFAPDFDPVLAARWIERLGLAGLEARRPEALSYGQQQRVALARAFARRNAGLVLLDEPFSALDAPLRQRLRREMLALQREMTATTILVTHDPAEAMLLADELLLLDAGRVLQAGPVAELYARPVNAAAALLLGAETIGHGRIDERGAIDIGLDVRLRIAGPELPVGSRVGWAVRPQHIRFDRQGAYAATIEERGVVRDGRRWIVLGFGHAVLNFFADPGCPDEGACRVNIDPEAIQVWPAPDDGCVH